MQKPFSPYQAVAVICLFACAGAAAAQTTPASPAATVQQNDAMLAKATGLYYSTTKAGLNGFTCAVHPDWQTLFVSANKGTTMATDDPRVVLLKTVKLTLHGQLKSASTLDWNAPANPSQPLDADSSTLLESMHGATSQTLLGFMQFWTPFMDGSTIPADSQGLEITQTATGHKIHTDQGGTTLNEELDKNLVLKEFDVQTGGSIVNFSPSYKSTEKGLVVNAFHAHIQPPGTAPEQAEEMNVQIEYQTIDGFPIPAKINITVINSGTFNFVLDGCTVNR